MGNGQYTVREGDSWERIAGNVYGDQRMFAALANANGWVSLHPGMVINLAEPQRDPYVGPEDIERANYIAAETGTMPYATYDELMAGGGTAVPGAMALPPLTGTEEGATAPGGEDELFQTPSAVMPGAEVPTLYEDLGVAGAGARGRVPIRSEVVPITGESGGVAGQSAVGVTQQYVVPQVNLGIAGAGAESQVPITDTMGVGGSKGLASIVPAEPEWEPAGRPISTNLSWWHQLWNDAERGIQQLFQDAQTNAEAKPVGDVGPQPTAPDWTPDTLRHAIGELLFPVIGSSVRLGRVVNQSENLVRDIVTGKFWENWKADFEANPSIAAFEGQLLRHYWDHLEHSTAGEINGEGGVGAASRGIASAIQAIGTLFSAGAVGVERIAGSIAIKIREDAKYRIDWEPGKGWHMDEQAPAGLTWGEAYQASRITYSTLFDEAPVHEFLRELENGADPVLLQRKYENPMAEMVGQTIFDPSWVFDIYNSGFITRFVNANVPGRLGPFQLAHLTRLERQTLAAKAHVLLDDRSLITQGVNMIGRAQTPEEVAQGFKLIRDGTRASAASTAERLKNFVRQRGAPDVAAEGRQFDMSIEAANDLLHLARTTPPDQLERTILSYILATSPGSTDGQVDEAIRFLMGWDEKTGTGKPHILISHLFSDSGIQVGQHLGDMFLDDAGRLSAGRVKWLQETVEEIGKLPEGERIDALLEKFGPLVEQSAARMNPDILGRIKYQEQIAELKAAGKWDQAPEWLRRFEDDVIPPWLQRVATADHWARQHIYAPVNSVLSDIFMGLSAPYGLRNFSQDSAIIFVDRPSAFFASRRNMEALTKACLGAIPGKAAQKFSGAVASLTAGKIRGKLFGYALAGWAEAKSSMKIFGRTLEEVMISGTLANQKATRAILDGAGVPEDVIKSLFALQRKNNFDPYMAVKALLGETGTVRVLSTNEALLQKLDKFPGLRDVLLRHLDEAKNFEDFEKRAQRAVASQRRFADLAASEEIILAPDDPLAILFAQMGPAGSGWDCDLLARRIRASQLGLRELESGFNQYVNRVIHDTANLPNGREIGARVEDIRATLGANLDRMGAAENAAAQAALEAHRLKIDAAVKAGATPADVTDLWYEYKRLEGIRDTLHTGWRDKRIAAVERAIAQIGEEIPEAKAILEAGFAPIEKGRRTMARALELDNVDPDLFQATGGRMYPRRTGYPAQDMMGKYGMAYTTPSGIPMDRKGLCTTLNNNAAPGVKPFTPEELASKSPDVWTPERLADLKDTLQRRNAARGMTIADAMEEAAGVQRESSKIDNFVRARVAGHGLDAVAEADNVPDLYHAMTEAGIPLETADAATIARWEKETADTGGLGAWAEYIPPERPPEGVGKMAPFGATSIEEVEGIARGDRPYAFFGGQGFGELPKTLPPGVEVARNVTQVAGKPVHIVFRSGTKPNLKKLASELTRIDAIADPIEQGRAFGRLFGYSEDDIRLWVSKNAPGRFVVNPDLQNQPLQFVRDTLTHEMGEAFCDQIYNSGLGWEEAQERLSAITRKLSGGSDLSLTKLEREVVHDTISDGVAAYFGTEREALMEGRSTLGRLKDLKPEEQKAIYQYIAREVVEDPDFAAHAGSVSGSAKPHITGPDGVEIHAERPINAPGSGTGPVSTAANAAAESEAGLEDLVSQVVEELRESWGKQPPTGSLNREALNAWADAAARATEETKVVATRVAGAARDWALHSYPSKRGFDHIASYIFPYQYWYSRTYMKMITRLARSPGYLATWSRYRHFVQQEHANLPDWWKNNISTDMLGIKLDSPLYFNLEAALMPLNGLTGVDFEDPNRRMTWTGRVVDDLGKFGPTPWMPFQFMVGIGSLIFGPKEQAEAWLGNRLLPQSQMIKSASHLLGVSAPTSDKNPFIGPAGLEIDPFVLIFQGGKGTTYEQKRVGRALGDLEQLGEITHDQAIEAARLKEGEIWDRAVELAASLRDPWNVVSGLFSIGLKARSAQEAEIDQAYAVAALLRKSKPNMSPEQYSSRWNEFYRRYPFMESVMIGRARGEDSDELYIWNVVSRVPPGQTTEWADYVHLDPDLLNKFYDTKGDLTKFTEIDRQSLMSGMIALGAILATPAKTTKMDWDAARAEYKRWFGPTPDVRKQEIEFNNLKTDAEQQAYLESHPALQDWIDLENGVDQFYNEQGKDPALGRQFLEEHPYVKDWLAYREKVIMSNPVLFKYYAGIDYVEKAWKREMYARGEQLFGEDIFDLQHAYFDLKDEGGDLRSFKATYPQLIDYWDWLSEEKAVLERRLAEVGALMPERVTASLRPDADEDSVVVQNVLKGLEESAPEDDGISEIALPFMTNIAAETGGSDFSIQAWMDEQAIQMWPGVLAKDQEYDRLKAENAYAARTYLAANQDLLEFQKWEKATRKAYNAGRPSPSTTATAIPWEGWVQTIDPNGEGVAPRMTVDYFRIGTMSADLDRYLRAVWARAGRPAGTFEKWLALMKTSWSAAGGSY